MSIKILVIIIHLFRCAYHLFKSPITPAISVDKVNGPVGSLQLKGLNFLGTLYDFIVARQSVEVDYKSFKATEATTWHLSPYLLKEYNNRWFVMVYNTGMEMIQNLALDRIVAIRPDNTGTYVENTFFEPEQFLGEMIGVSRNLDSVPQRVTLRVEAQNAPYVFTKPTHSSQQLLSTNADGSVVIALDVIINYELRSHLLSMIPWVEVLAPESLRLSIAGLLNTAAARYNYSR